MTSSLYLKRSGGRALLKGRCKVRTSEPSPTARSASNSKRSKVFGASGRSESGEKSVRSSGASCGTPAAASEATATASASLACRLRSA